MNLSKILLATVGLILPACQQINLHPDGGEATAPAPVAQHLGDLSLENLPAPAPQVSGHDIYETLIKGEEVNRQDWPVTVYSSQGNSRCTANVIGEDTLLVAAHCVGNGKSATFTLLDGKSYSSVCTHAPQYSGNSTADWSLCKVGTKVTGYPFERVNVDSTKPAVGDKILLMGYGCIQAGGSGGNDGKLRAGEAPVIQVPSGSSFDIVTKGEHALCFGDSGGPAWIYLDAQKKIRAQVSVNSRGDIQTTSYLSSLANATFKAFVMDWATKNNAKVCGVHADAPNCRGTDGPGPSPLPEHCKVSFDKVTACLWGTPRLALTKPEECQVAYADLFACEEIAERQDAP